MTNIAVAPIAPEHAHPLRHALLHPDQPPAFSIYPTDGAATTLHVGAFADGTLAGIASVCHEAPPASAQAGAWRLRDMAVAPSMRRRGCASALLRACLDHAAAHGGTMFWCNARPTALPFYLAHGFRVQGDAFEMPGFGLRHLMWRGVDDARNADSANPRPVRPAP